MPSPRKGPDPKLIDFVRAVVPEMEAKEKDWYKPTFSTGKSGLSFGRFQHDVKNNEKARKGFTNILKLAETRGEIDQAFRARAGIRAQYDAGQRKRDPEPLTEAEKDEIARILRRPESRPIIDDLDRQRAENVAGQVEEVLRAAKKPHDKGGALNPDDPDPEAVALLAAWANRENLKSMPHYVANLDGPVTVQVIRERMAAFKQFRPKPDGNGEDFQAWSGRAAAAARKAAHRLRRPRAAPAAGGGSVHVDAHARDGHPVQQHYRSPPGQGAAP